MENYYYYLIGGAIVVIIIFFIAKKLFYRHYNITFSRALSWSSGFIEATKEYPFDIEHLPKNAETAELLDIYERTKKLAGEYYAAAFMGQSDTRVFSFARLRILKNTIKYFDLAIKIQIALHKIQVDNAAYEGGL